MPSNIAAMMQALVVRHTKRVTAGPNHHSQVFGLHAGVRPVRCQDLGTSTLDLSRLRHEGLDGLGLCLGVDDRLASLAASLTALGGESVDALGPWCCCWCCCCR
jgi:hypothetical protein